MRVILSGMMIRGTSSSRFSLYFIADYRETYRESRTSYIPFEEQPSIHQKMKYICQSHSRCLQAIFIFFFSRLDRTRPGPYRDHINSFQGMPVIWSPKCFAVFPVYTGSYTRKYPLLRNERECSVWVTMRLS